MSKGIVELSEQNFDKEVIDSEAVALVDFWAAWCGPCKALTPVLEEIALESRPGVKIAKVNVDDSPGLASRWDVMNIPTMILFKGGKEVDRLFGLMPKAKISERIKRLL